MEQSLSAWRTASPESQGMDLARLDNLCVDLAVQGTTALLIARHDEIVYEWYAPDYGLTRRHYTASLAKALVGGLALGLACADGRVQPDDLAAKYIPAWRDDPLKSRITLRHLVTHSSGIEDAETPGKAHLDQGGWKAAFWRRDPDPFSIALSQAPVLFPPGSRYAYSNPGIAALAYALTASLKDAPQTNIRTLLQQRIMLPLGIAEDDWSIGYGQAYPLDGLELYATWGGGEYTSRAVARLGLLMLHHGTWQGQQLIPAAWVDKIVAYAGTPIQDRSSGEPNPAAGLGWWTNFDGVWYCLPRDAFAGAGAGNQLLLVVPCRDLVVVRNGELLGEGFWSGVEKKVFIPLIDAFKDRQPGDAAQAPYPPSPLIREIAFAPVSTIVRRAFDSDNWPITWADDDQQYTAYGDGRGFEPYTPQKLGLGFARVSGPPDDFYGANLRAPGAENAGNGASGAKASGMLMVEGILYLWVRNAANSQLAWSRDHGQTWTWSDWKFTTSFGHPVFLNFGKNYAGARDEYVYVYSHDANSAYQPADRMVMARVAKDHLNERDAYEFFKELDGQGHPVWTEHIEQRGAIFVHPGRCLRSSISYNAGLGRYLWWQQVPNGQDVDTRFSGGFGIYDAPQPWGPWTTAYFTAQWDTGPGEMGSFPTKWMSGDGKTCYLVFSGNDYFSVRKVIFTLKVQV